MPSLRGAVTSSGAVRLGHRANLRYQWHMRLTTLLTLVGTIGLSACAGAQSPATAPGSTDPLAYGDQPHALPRYFSVEILPTGLKALGEDVSDEQLRYRAAQEAADPTLQGATVVVDSSVSESRALDVVRILVSAGFKHVVFSSREGLRADVALPHTDSTAADVAILPATPVPTQPPAPAPAETSASPATPSVDSEIQNTTAIPNNVEVKQMGLHVGGGPNDEPTHALYSTPIVRRFDDLKRCYPLATGAGKNASFGVDLLISTRGGTAKIKDYRTVLGGKDFHLCVLGVFGTIEFPAPPKATMVSYSVLFKPL